MAVSESMTFEAEADRVWVTLVRLVNSAGYAVSEINAAAKQIKYQATGGGWAWAQLVTVSITGLENNETLVTVKAEAVGQATLTQGGQQRKLVEFIFIKLNEKFPLSQSQTERVTTGAPGTSGCMVL